MAITRKRGLAPTNSAGVKTKRARSVSREENSLSDDAGLQSCASALEVINLVSEDVIDLVSEGEDINHRSTRHAAGPSVINSTVPTVSVITPAVSEPIAARPVANAAYDVCFGMIYVNATASGATDVPGECTPVTLEIHGRVIRINRNSTNQRIAVVVSDALLRLVNEFPVTLTATLCGRKRKPLSVHALGAQTCSLRIIVYGFLQQKDAVGDILAREELFFQHPSELEFDRSVKYVNPHYLLPPGEDMPPIETLSVSACCWSRTSRSDPAWNSLNENEINQVQRIFDTAYVPTNLTALIEPSSRLITKLKRHQLEALVMMVEKEAGIYDYPHFPTLWERSIGPSGRIRYQNIVTTLFETSRPPPLGGGILADEMGLGKTLSSLSLVCHSLDVLEKNPQLRNIRPKTTLVVTPKSTIYAWENQIKSHINPDKIKWITYYGPRREEKLGDICDYDVVLTTYDTVRSEEAREGPLFKHQWTRVILDEAHKIRNRTSRIFRAVCKIRADYRWCLTGTPIQNCLDDFGALLEFIKAEPLDSKDLFGNLIADPIKNKKKDSIEMLRKVVAATCLRRTKGDHLSTVHLPRKTESVEQVQMNRNDREVYEFFKRFSYLTAGVDGASKKKATTNILALISLLRLICNHGTALLSKSALKAWNTRDEKLLTREMLESTLTRCTSCHCEIEDLGATGSLVEELSCGHLVCDNCVTISQNSSNQLSCSQCIPGETSTSSTSSPGDDATPVSSQNAINAPSNPQHQPSAKLEAILRNMVARQKTRDPHKPIPKSVIFSHWTKMLDLLGFALRQRGLSFQRIDGQSSLSQRKAALERFTSDPGCNIMLASIGAAGEGIDLTVANSVHLVEPHWNPMAEAQAIDRVHRIGQEQDVEVVRYITDQSIEEYVRWVQMHKLRLIKESFSTADPNTETAHATEVRWQKLLEYLE